MTEAHQPPAVQAGQVAGALQGVRRPVPALLLYYVLVSIAAGPAIIVVLPLRFFRFRTLQYEFDDEGVTMRWGLLFRREISLTYARIQDIHLVSNVVERWLRLGRVEIQTASGQSAAEMTIEGQPDFERLRDELYQRMRGAKQHGRVAATAVPSAPAEQASSTPEAVAALRDAVEELRTIRLLLSKGQS